MGAGWAGVVPPGTIASVNGNLISHERFDEEMRRALQRFSQRDRAVSPELEGRLRAHTLRRLIDEVLLEQKAKAEGIAVSEGELDAMLQQHRARFPTEEAHAQALQRAGKSLDDTRREMRIDTLRDRIAARALLERRPSEDEARAYYARHPERFHAPEERWVRQVLWPRESPGDSPQDTQADPATQDTPAAPGAAAIARAWHEHPEEAADIVFRAPPGSPRGIFRDLGWVARAQLPGRLDEAVFRAESGAVVGPLESELGIHVLHVYQARGGEVLPFEAVRERIVSILEGRLRTRVVRELVESLKAQATVEVFAEIDWRRARGGGGGTFGEPGLTRGADVPPSAGGSVRAPPSPPSGIDAGPPRTSGDLVDEVEVAPPVRPTPADTTTGVRDLRQPADGSQPRPEVIAR